MSSVDERVVEMRFDNAQFENGVKTTMSSLESLRKSLDENTQATTAFKGLDTAAQSSAASLETISAAMDSLSNRFSTMGIVGMTIVQQLTTSLMSLGATITNKVISPIVSGGWRRATNLEKAEFQITGLKKSWSELNDDMQYAVDGTAYGLDAAASAAGQLSASGIEAGQSMKNALRGISGVAAMTGSSYEDISRIFIQVAGNGRLMGDQLLEISSRGINAASTLADYLGTDEATVRNMVSKGEIDFATFSTAMDQAFGAHAKDANKTFTGAMSNVGSALSKIGAMFEQIMISSDDYTTSMKGVDEIIKNTTGDVNVYGQLQGRWFANLITLANNYREFLNAIKASLQGGLLKPMVDDFTVGFHAISLIISTLITNLYNVQQNGKTLLNSTLEKALSNIYQSFKNIVDFIIGVNGSISAAWNSIFPVSLIDTIEGITEEFKNLTDMLPKPIDTLQTLGDIFGVDLVSAFNDSKKAVEDTTSAVTSAAEPVVEAAETVQTAYNGVTGSLQDLARAVVRGDYGNGADRVAALGDSYQQIQDAVNHCYYDFNNLDEGLDSLTGTVGEVTVVTDTATTSVENVAEAAETASDSTEDLNNSEDNVNGTTKKTITFFDNLKDTFSGLFSVVDIVKKAFEGIVTLFKTFAIPAIGRMIEVISSITGSIGSWITALDNSLPPMDDFNSFVSQMAEFLKPVSDVLYTVTGFMISFFDSLRPGNDIISNLIDWFNNLKTAISDFFSSIKMPSGNTLLDDLQPILEPLSKFLSGAYSTISKCLDIIGTAFSKFIKKINIPGDPVGDFVNLLLGALENLIKFITPAVDTLSAIADKLGPIFSNILEAIANFIADYISTLHISEDPFGDLISTITNGWDNLVSFVTGLEFPNGSSILDMFKAMIDPVIEYFTNLGGTIGDIFSSIFGPTTAYASEINSNSADSVNGGTNLIQDALQAFSDFLSFISDAIQQSFTNISNAIGGFLDDCKGYADEIYEFAKGMTVVYMGLQIGSLFGSISYFIKNVGDVAGGVSDLIRGLSKAAEGFKNFDVAHFLGIEGAVKAWQEDLKADAIKKIAIAVAILAGSLFLVSFIPAEDLKKAAIALAAGLGALVIASKFMSKINPNTLKGMGLALIGLSIAVGILYFAMNKFKDFTGDEIQHSLEATVGVILGLAVAIRIMKSKSGDLNNAVISIFALAASVYILEKAIEAFSKLTPAQFASGVGSVIITLLALIGSIWLINKSFGKTGSKTTAETALTILALAGSVYILQKVVEAFGNMDADKLKQGGLATALTLAAVCGAIAVINWSSKGAKKSAVGIISIALALLVMYAVIWLYYTIPFDTMLVGLLKCVATLGVLVIVLSAINHFSKDAVSCGLTLLGLAAAIVAIAAALWIISFIPTDKIEGCVSALSTVLIWLGIAVSMINETSKGMSDAVPEIIAMIVAVVAIAAALWILSTIKSDEIETSVNALCQSLLIFSLGLSMINASSETLTTTGLVGIGLMIGAVVALSAAMFILSKCGMDELSGSMTALTTAIFVFAGAFAVIALTAGNMTVEGLVGIGLMAVAVGVLAYSMNQLAQCDPASLATATDSLCEAIFVFAGALAVLSLVGAASFAGIVGIVAMAAAVLVITYALQTLSAIDPNSICASILELAAVLAIIIIALAAFTVVGVAADAAVPGLLAIGAACLMIGAGVYFAAEGIADLIDALGRLMDTLANIIAGAVNMGSNIVQGLANGLMNGLGSLSNFAQSVWDFIVNGIKSLFGIASPSTVMASIGGYIVQGLGQGIQNMLGTLGSAVLSIGQTILSGVASIPGNLVTAGGNIASAIGDGINSFMQDPIGSMKNLGQGMLDTIGSLFAPTEAQAEEIPQAMGDGVTNNADALKDDVQGSVDSSMDVDTTSASDAGSAEIEAYSASMSENDFRALLAAQGVSQEAIDGLMTTVDQCGGIGSLFTNGFSGGVTAESFSAQLAAMGVSQSVIDQLLAAVPAAGDAATQTGDSYDASLEASTAPAADTAYSSVQEVMAAYQNGEISDEDLYGYIQKVSETGDSAETEASDTSSNVMSNLTNGNIDGTDMYGMVSAVESTGESAQSSMGPMLDSLKSMASSSGSDSGTSWISGFTDSLGTNISTDSISSSFSTITDSASQSGTDAANAFGESFNSTVSTVISPDAMSGAASQVTEGLATGITNGSQTVVDAFNTVVSDVNTQSTTAFSADTFSSSGQAITTSLATGITNSSQSVIDAANNLGATTAAALNTSISTSITPDIFTQIGSNIPVWISSGITSNLSLIGGAVSLIGLTLSSTITSDLDPASFSYIGSSIVDSISSGIYSGASIAMSAASYLGSSIYSVASSSINYNSFYSIGVYASSGIAAGISSGIGIAVSYAQSMSSSVKSAFSTLPNDMIGAAEKGVSGFLGALIKGVGSARSAASALGGAAYSGIRENMSGFVNVGTYAADGFARGITNGSINASIAAYAMGRAALAAAKKAIDSNSPSKEFMKLGMYSDQGMAIGLTKYSHVAEDASKDVAKSTLNAMGDLGSKISAAMNSVDSPAITPVLDFSNIQNGSDSIDGLVSDHTIAMDYSNSQLGYISTGLSKNQEAQYANAAKMDSVVTKLGDIGSRIATLEGNLPGYIYDNTPSQVVMDGTKVGKMVAPTVNIEMGISQVRENRGL